MKKKILIGLGVVLSLSIGYGVAYAQGVRIQFLGGWGDSYGSGQHGVYRVNDGPNVCYVAKGVESISIYCIKN